MSQRRGDAEGGERRDLLRQRKRRAQRPREPSAEASIVVGVGDLWGFCCVGDQPASGVG